MRDTREMTTVAEHWLSFLHDVIPKRAGRVQVEECQLSFYAGGMAALALVKDLTDRGAGPREIDKLQTELLTLFQHRANQQRAEARARGER